MNKNGLSCIRLCRQAVSKSSGIKAYAKLTLYLKVKGISANGLHEIESEMITVDLADDLEFSPGTGIVLEGPMAQTLDIKNDADNLVTKALKLCGKSYKVKLTKRIPARAGLGGGSADAAAVLRYLGIKDFYLAKKLGSDVPFCLLGGKAKVRGTGEILEPIEFESKSFVLFILPYYLDTYRVYKTYDEIGAGDFSSGNDLENAAFYLEPRIHAWKNFLERTISKKVSLAGSGPTLYCAGNKNEIGLSSADHIVLNGEAASIIEVNSVKY
jgi:4-diphosphocytidyl-2-C-methyl-D-erythritol kinase